LLDVRSAVVVPWGAIGSVVAVSALLAVVFAVLPASLVLRVGPAGRGLSRRAR
ncbi:hypothetical protein JGS39_39410, partial [Streptomyces sp. P01-B04]|nr:hypothetical protein [Streptomyces poriferorum]